MKFTNFGNGNHVNGCGCVGCDVLSDEEMMIVYCACMLQGGVCVGLGSGCMGCVSDISGLVWVYGGCEAR